MKKQIFAWITAISVMLLIPMHAHAHSGLPFLRVNNKFTVSNPEYTSGNNTHVAQDVAIDTFQPGQTIRLEVDKAGLGLSDETISQVTFRWHLQSSDEFKNGLKTDYRFEKSGTYLIFLETKSPNSFNFVPFDSVELKVIKPLKDEKNHNNTILIALGTISAVSSIAIVLLILKK